MTAPIDTLVLASGNAGKLRELKALLGPAGVRVVSQGELGVTDAEEPFGTFVENALAKARHASAATGLPAIADDSGLCLAGLRGEPGVRSARWAGEGPQRSDAANNARLVRELATLTDTSAEYCCVLVLVRHPLDPQPVIAEGRWLGEVIADARGREGFGYDPHFLLPELGRTVAELDAAAKNRLSHRGQAMQALLERLRASRLLPPA